MKKTCALCGQQKPLLKSHIIPAFIFKWFKETSGTGYLRFAENPNVRVQDGLKIELLCETCEGTLNKWETEFSNKIFHPYNSNTSVKVHYSDWLLRFCTSVSWRVLQYHINERNALEKATELQKKEMLAASTVWRDFLNNKRVHPGKYEQHLLPMDIIGETSDINTPENINRFILRNIELDIVSSKKTLMTYTKMGKFLLFGHIIPFKQKWRGSKISLNQGTFGSKKYELPMEIADFIFDRARNSSNVYNQISEKQEDKIQEHILNNLDQFRQSDQMKAMLADERLFGTDVIIKK